MKNQNFRGTLNFEMLSDLLPLFNISFIALLYIQGPCCERFDWVSEEEVGGTALHPQVGIEGYVPGL